MDNLYEDQYTFWIISRSILIVQTKIVEIINTHIQLITFYCPSNALNCIKLKG